MTEPDKADALLSKADALLGRYRPSAIAPATSEAIALPAGMSAEPTTDSTADSTADFPVLTEVVELPVAATGAHTPTLTAAAANNVADKAVIDETRLREEILATLAPDLEQRLSDTLKPRATELFDWAMQTVQLELGLSIRAAVRSAVAEAVDKALERHRSGTNADKP